MRREKKSTCTTARIRRHIQRIVGNKPFSTRELLGYGSRSAVDQTMCRLVSNGEIIRVARGLFTKRKAPPPTVFEVAEAKANAFKRTIATHGSTQAIALQLTTGTGDNHIFACSGHTSSFRFNQCVIHLIGSCPRKMHLGNAPVGLLIRTLWWLGEPNCDFNTISRTVQSFTRLDRQNLRLAADVMPDWLKRRFPKLTYRYTENTSALLKM